MPSDIGPVALFVTVLTLDAATSCEQLKRRQRFEATPLRADFLPPSVAFCRSKIRAKYRIFRAKHPEQ
jgi:hypothetical protein